MATTNQIVLDQNSLAALNHIRTRLTVDDRTGGYINHDYVASLLDSPDPDVASPVRHAVLWLIIDGGELGEAVASIVTLANHPQMNELLEPLLKSRSLSFGIRAEICKGLLKQMSDAAVKAAILHLGRRLQIRS